MLLIALRMVPVGSAARSDEVADRAHAFRDRWRPWPPRTDRQPSHPLWHNTLTSCVAPTDGIVDTVAPAFRTAVLRHPLKANAPILDLSGLTTLPVSNVLPRVGRTIGSSAIGSPVIRITPDV